MEWRNIYPILVGGALSLAGALVVLIINQRHQLAANERAREESKATLAVRAAVKLLQYANVAFSIKGTIDSQFDVSDGRLGMEPCQRVQEILGFHESFDQFQPDEISFLLHSSDASLVSDLLVFERRALGHIIVLKKFNELKVEMGKMMEGTSNNSMDDTEAILTASLVGQDAIKMDLRIRQANNILGNLMAHLDRDTREVVDLMDRFKKGAREQFGDLFPNIALEPVQK